MKFNYLGETYEVSRSTYNFCTQRNLVNRLFASTSMGKRENFFFILSIEDPDFRWFCAHSKNPKYYTRFNNATKHKVIPNLTKQQCRFLDKLTRNCSTFQDAIKLAKEAVETIIEIS